MQAQLSLGASQHQIHLPSAVRAEAIQAWHALRPRGQSSEVCITTPVRSMLIALSPQCNELSPVAVSAAKYLCHYLLGNPAQSLGVYAQQSVSLLGWLFSFGGLQLICSFDVQVYGAIASTLSSMGLSVVLDHAIEENLIHIPVALLHSRSALQLDEALSHCSNDAAQLCGSAILQCNALQSHGWKVRSLPLMPQSPATLSCSLLAHCKLYFNL